MKKLYIYNCNNLNELLDVITTEHPEQYEGCSTEIPWKKCGIPGKSYAFNKQSQQWDILIEDYRGVLLFKKKDSRVNMLGKVGSLPEDYTNIEPPNQQDYYKWNEDKQVWQEVKICPNPRLIIKSYENAIQKYIDQVAQARGYDNGYTCESYYKDINPRYASDAQRFKVWRSQIWTTANQLLNNYLENSSQIPSQLPSIESIIASFPIIEWEEI